jgi:hypothetical protein
MFATRTFDLRSMGIDGDVICKVIATPRPSIVRVPLDQHGAARERVAALIAEGARHHAGSTGPGWHQREAQANMASCFADARRIIVVAFFITPSIVDPLFAAWVTATHTEAVAIDWARSDASGSFWPKPKERPKTPVHLSEVPKLWRKFQRLVEEEDFDTARRIAATTTPDYPCGFYVRPSDGSESFVLWIKGNVTQYARDGLRADLDANGRKVRDFFD